MNKKDIEEYVMINKLNQEFLFDFVTLRHKLGLSQEEMAQKSNVLRDKITKIETGRYSPTITSLFKILGAFGYTLKIEKIKK